MVVDGLPTDFLFCRVSGVRLDWELIPLTARMQPIQNVVEHLIERYRAYIPALGFAQKRTDIFIELFFGYTGRNSAHDWRLREEFFINHAALFSFSKV